LDKQLFQAAKVHPLAFSAIVGGAIITRVFNTNLMRMIAGQLHCLVGMTAAHEMFGKSYFSLGIAEKVAVDNAVNGIVAGNFQAITPAFLAAQKDQQQVGFGIPAAAPTKEKS
jgi:hypothetical protein